MAEVPADEVPPAEKEELFCTYAAMILKDSELDISEEKINTLIKAAGGSVSSFFPALFAKLCAGKDLESMLKFGGGGGGGGPCSRRRWWWQCSASSGKDGGEKSRGGGRGGRNGVRLIRLDFTRFEVTLSCKPHDQKLCRRKKILRDCFWRAANSWDIMFRLCNKPGSLPAVTIRHLSNRLSLRMAQICSIKLSLPFQMISSFHREFVSTITLRDFGDLYYHMIR